MSFLNRKVKQKYPHSKKTLERHPTMHRTDTLDCFVVVRGEVYLVSGHGRGPASGGRHGRGARR